MNRKILKFEMLATIIITVGLFSLPGLVRANDNCTNVKGNLSVVNNLDGTTSGIITQGGKLNGTTKATFSSAPVPTPDAGTISYIDNFSITTSKGTLVTSNVAIYDTANGFFSEIARINSNSSEGHFMGARGTLFINGYTTDAGATFQAKIEGEICSTSNR